MFEGKDVTVILANGGAGKCLPDSALIPTPCGFVRNGELKAGDYVYSADGKATKVLGVYPQGKKEAYKVTFSDGRYTVCNDEHLWGIYTRHGKHLNEWQYSVMSLKEMLEKGIRKNAKSRTIGNAKFYIPSSPVVEGTEKELPCNPYVLGSFIGNGSCREKYLTLSSNDEWQVNKCASLLDCTVKRNVNNYSWYFYKEGKRVKTRDVIPSELCCYAHEKSIPSVYMFASVEQRKALLQGLFDTDGSVNTSSGRLHVSYSTSSVKLCSDVTNLLLTFGIVSSVHEDTRREHINYELKVNCSKEKALLLLTLPRKLERVMKFERKVHRDYSKVAVRSVEKLNEKLDMTCIYVEDEKHLYLCSDFVVTHNTTYIVNDIIKELEVRRPEEVAFVTFTRNGAQEGLRRVSSKLMLDADDLPYFRTLHSLTYHAMNYEKCKIFGKMEQRKFNKEYGYALNRCEVGTGKVSPTKDTMYLDYYDLMRSDAITSRQIANADIELGYYNQLVSAYNEFKEKEGTIDFFDCLINYAEKGEPLPCKVVYVDECQDISVLQWKVIEKAFCNAEKVVIVGDDKQSIFTYNGARPDILISLAKKFPVKRLSMSYRLPKKAFLLANAVTSFIGNKTPQESVFKKDNPEGSIVQLTDIERITHYIDVDSLYDNVDENAWFLLARNTCFLDSIKSALEDALIPYWTADGFFMGGEIMQRIKTYEGIKNGSITNEEKIIAFQRKFEIADFNVPFTSTNLFTEGRKWVYASYIERFGLEALQDMCKWNPQILVSTIHHVKGAEARNVALLLDTTRRTRGNVFYDVDEELRVLYVGVTRTKENLYLIDSKNGDGFDSIINTIKKENHLEW